MSLPSFAKDKTSNKVSLVTRPTVTLVQPVEVIGSSASQPTLIYVQSTKPPAQQTYITPKVNKPKSSSQPVSIRQYHIVTNKAGVPTRTVVRPTAQKIAPIPSTSSTSSTPSSSPNPNRVHAFQVKEPNSVLTTNPQKPIIFNQSTVAGSRAVLNDKPVVTRITKITTASTVSTPIKDIVTVPKLPTTSAAALPNVTKVDPIKFRYRTILENLLQLKNSFIRSTITKAIQQKLCKQSNEDLLNVIFKSFELTLLSVNVEQIQLNVGVLFSYLQFFLDI